MPNRHQHPKCRPSQAAYAQHLDTPPATEQLPCTQLYNSSPTTPTTACTSSHITHVHSTTVHDCHLCDKPSLPNAKPGTLPACCTARCRCGIIMLSANSRTQHLAPPTATKTRLLQVVATFSKQPTPHTTTPLAPHCSTIMLLGTALQYMLLPCSARYCLAWYHSAVHASPHTSAGADMSRRLHRANRGAGRLPMLVAVRPARP